MLFKPCLPVLLLCSVAAITGCDDSGTNPSGQIFAGAGNAEFGDKNTVDAFATGSAAYTDGTAFFGGSDGVKAESQAHYRLTFEDSWSSPTHVTRLSNGPFFSDSTGLTHGASVSLWEPGQQASAGVRQVEELGRRDTIIASIRETIAEGSARQLVEGAAMANAPDAVSLNF